MFQRSREVSGIVLSILILSGCSPSRPGGVLTPEERALLATPASVDLFSARGFLGGSDYERYVLKENVLWRECGSVQKIGEGVQTRAKLRGDEFLSNNPGLLLEERRVELLTEEEAVAVRKELDRFFAALGESRKKAPPPGSVHALSGPGIFELQASLGERRQHFVTSVDAVAEERLEVARAARSLFSTLRGIGPVICNSRTFFGIRRDEVRSGRR